MLPRAAFSQRKPSEPEEWAGITVIAKSHRNNELPGPKRRSAPPAIAHAFWAQPPASSDAAGDNVRLERIKNCRANTVSLPSFATLLRKPSEMRRSAHRRSYSLGVLVRQGRFTAGIFGHFRAYILAHALERRECGFRSNSNDAKGWLVTQLFNADRRPEQSHTYHSFLR